MMLPVEKARLHMLFRTISSGQVPLEKIVVKLAIMFPLCTSSGSKSCH